ncbi:MAG: hypothetical protein WBC44_22850, partial [Planctomycetaceae bacterium]
LEHPLTQLHRQRHLHPSAQKLRSHTPTTLAPPLFLETAVGSGASFEEYLSEFTGSADWTTYVPVFMAPKVKLDECQQWGADGGNVGTDPVPVLLVKYQFFNSQQNFPECLSVESLGCFDLHPLMNVPPPKMSPL